MKHRVFVNDRVHVRRRACKTCIFGRNSPVGVERRDGMVKECGDVGVIPCHTHLYRGQPVNPVCRAFYDLRVNVLLRLATSMDVIEWVE